MQVFTTSQQLRETLKEWRLSNQSIALVPTMGNLHDGHLHLVEVAKQHASKIVVTIFVNPLQFSPGGDFDNYPRTLQHDRDKLGKHDVDLVFCPEVSSIYPQGVESSTKVIVPDLSDLLCGKFRPGHFDGVTTVVAMLFNLVQPDVAVFGEKDFQQLVIIRRMVEDLHFPIKIVGVETIREDNGLAMSSRNTYLSSEEMNTAALLHSVLESVASRVKQRISSENTSFGNFKDIERAAMQELTASGFRPDYIKVCYADDLSDANPMGGLQRSIRVLGAAWLGKARLIDNIALYQ